MKRILLALALLCTQGSEEPQAPCWLNHSGVEECYADISHLTLPVDTTGGADIIL